MSKSNPVTEEAAGKGDEKSTQVNDGDENVCTLPLIFWDRTYLIGYRTGLDPLRQ